MRFHRCHLRIDISPWGEVATDTGSITRLRMAGQQYDQGSELYYMRARCYDPALGRFLSEDPIGISGGLNLYAYAGNDPVNAADPSGMLTCAPHAYRVTVVTATWQDYDGRHVEADTAWDKAVGVGLDCWGDNNWGGSPVPGTMGTGKVGGPGAVPDGSSADNATMGRGARDCYDRNKLSSAVANVSGSQTAGDIVQVVEVGSIISVGADLFATVLKASRSGAGGVSNPMAIGFNYLAKRVIKGAVRGASPDAIGRLVGGAKAVGDRLSPALLLTAAFSVAYNATTDLECRLGVIE